MSYYSIVGLYYAFWTAVIFGGFYLLRRLHRMFYVRRSALSQNLIGECYTPEQIRAAFHKIFAPKLGPKVTPVCNAFLLQLSRNSDGGEL